MKEQHSPLNPVCAIKITYKSGETKRHEFRSHAEKMQAMLNMDMREVERVEETPVDETWRSIGEVTKRVIEGMQKECFITKK